MNMLVSLQKQNPLCSACVCAVQVCGCMFCLMYTTFMHADLYTCSWYFCEVMFIYRATPTSQFKQSNLSCHSTYMPNSPHCNIYQMQPYNRSGFKPSVFCSHFAASASPLTCLLAVIAAAVTHIAFQKSHLHPSIHLQTQGLCSYIGGKLVTLCATFNNILHELTD